MAHRCTLAGLSPARAARASRPHLRDAMAAEHGPHEKQGAVGRVTVGKGSGRGGPLRCRRPAFGGAGAAEQCRDEGPVGGDGGIVLDPTLVLEPFQPVEHGVDPTAGPHRLAPFQHQPPDPVGVVGGLGVFDGGFGSTVPFVPSGGPQMQVTGIFSASRRFNSACRSCRKSWW